MMVTAAAALLCVVVSITDGDTLRADCGDGPERIRLADIDAPEVDGRCEAERRLASKARDDLRRLTEGRVAEVRRVDFDRFGRMVALVSIEGADLGAWLVARGLAKPWPHEGGRALTPRPRWCGAE